MIQWLQDLFGILKTLKTTMDKVTNVQINAEGPGKDGADNDDVIEPILWGQNLTKHSSSIQLIKVGVSHDDLIYANVIKTDHANYHISHLIYLMFL